jgi:CHASE2 domain-containing sensor protein
MESRGVHSPTRWILLILLLSGFLAVRESNRAPLSSWDSAFTRWLLVQRKPLQQPAPLVVLVEIDNQSRALKPEWPWAPLDYALFLKAVLPQKPSVVVIHPLLAWEEGRPDYFSLLMDYTLRTPKLLLSAELGSTRDPDLPAGKFPVIQRVHGAAAQVVEMPSVEGEPEGELREAAQVAPANLSPSGACAGLTPLLCIKHAGQIVPTSPLRAAALHLKLSTSDLELFPGEAILLGDRLRVPVDASGRMRIDPRAAAAVTRIGYDDLLLEVEKKESNIPTGDALQALEGAIVILGRTDSEARVCDAEALGKISPAESLAGAIATALTVSFLAALPDWTDWVIVLLAFVLWPFVAKIPKFTLLIIAAAVSAAYAMMAVAIASAFGIALPLAIPAAMLAVLLVLRLLLPGGKPAQS